jgi:hypothetical protein
MLRGLLEQHVDAYSSLIANIYASNGCLLWQDE